MADQREQLFHKDVDQCHRQLLKSVDRGWPTPIWCATRHSDDLEAFMTNLRVRGLVVGRLEGSHFATVSLPDTSQE